MNIIDIRNLNYNILDELYLSIPNNKLVFLSGPNNCGKTLLLKIIDKKIEIPNSIYINNILYENLNIKDYYKNIRCIFPNKTIFIEEKVEDEIANYEDELNLLKKFKIAKYKKSNIENLDIKNKIRLQILLELLNKPKVLLIDELDKYFDNDEMFEIIDILKEYKDTYNMTIVLTTINLKYTVKGDYLIIMNNTGSIMEGNPLKVLEKDNILNKLGLEVPFIIDLSVKLKDYDLLKEIELDKNRIINELWK